jgi:hypothetical protein
VVVLRVTFGYAKQSWALGPLFMFETVKAIHEALGITSPKIFIATVTVLFALIGFVAAEIVERGYQNTLRRNSASTAPQQAITPTPSILTPSAGTVSPDNPPLPRKKNPPRKKDRPKEGTINLEQRSVGPNSPNIATFGDNSPVTLNSKPNPYAPIVYYDFNGVKHVQQGTNFRAEAGDQYNAFLQFAELEKKKDWTGLRDLAEAQMVKAPEWLTAYIAAGTAYANLGEIAEATKRLQYVVDNAPPNDSHYAAAGKILNQIRQQR